jgi:peptidyl-prolyl isomerase D
MRYLDVHPMLFEANLPENTDPTIQEEYKTLLASLLLNSSLAALKVPSAANYKLAVANTTRALDKLLLSDADKGMFPTVVPAAS